MRKIWPAYMRSLEKEIIPLYYDRRPGDLLPEKWVQKTKECIRTLAPRFSMTRMVKEYSERLYLPVLTSEVVELDQKVK